MQKTQKQQSRHKNTKIIFWCVVFVLIWTALVVANAYDTAKRAKGMFSSETQNNNVQNAQQQMGVYTNVGKVR